MGKQIARDYTLPVHMLIISITYTYAVYLCAKTWFTTGFARVGATRPATFLAESSSKATAAPLRYPRPFAPHIF